MEQKQENPIKLLLSWSGKSKRYLFASVACAFASGLFVIGPYIGIYNLMDAILSENITQRLLVNNIVLISATTILRMITLACSGVLSHKGAYGALYRVRCMIVEHLAKVPLGVLDDRSTGEIKTVLNEDLTPHTVREIHKLLRNAFNQAVKWELMSRNPVLNR